MVNTVPMYSKTQQIWHVEFPKFKEVIYESEDGFLFRELQGKEKGRELYSFSYIKKDLSESLWKDEPNNDLAQIKKGYASKYSIFKNLLFIRNFSSETTQISCYKITDGTLLWTLDNNILENKFVYSFIQNQRVYFYSCQNEKMNIIEVNPFIGTILRKLNIEKYYSEKPKQGYYHSLRYIDDKLAVFCYNELLQCYSIVDNKIIWHEEKARLVMPEEHDAIFYNYLIYPTSNSTEFTNFDEMIICILDVANGNRIEIEGCGYQFYIQNNKLFFYNYEETSNKKSYTGCINVYDLSKMKVINKLCDMKLDFRVNGFFKYGSGIIQLQGSALINNSDIINIYSDELKLIDTIKMEPELFQYNITNDHLFAICKIEKSKTLYSYDMYCFQLPNTLETNKEQFPITNIIKFIICYILRKITGQP